MTGTINRPYFTNWLSSWRDKDIIKVVTGIRRCGITTLLRLFRDKLLAEGINPRQIVSINFEDTFSRTSYSSNSSGATATSMLERSTAGRLISSLLRMQLPDIPKLRFPSETKPHSKGNSLRSRQSATNTSKTSSHSTTILRSTMTESVRSTQLIFSSTPARWRRCNEPHFRTNQTCLQRATNRP